MSATLLRGYRVLTRLRVATWLHAGNVAVGFAALASNTTVGMSAQDGANVAIGFGALRNTNGTGTHSGGGNNAVGQEALNSNTTGYQNNAFGYHALQHNTTGSGNIAIGAGALEANTTGSLNIAIGHFALFSLPHNDDNIFIGNEQPVFGATHPAGGFSHTIIIRGNATSATFIGGIRGVTPDGGNGIPVFIDEFGQLGTVSSSRRFKNEIEPMDIASEAILALKPVTFHYKSDKTSRPEFGLIAEEVAQVNPDLIVRDAKGEIYTVRYDAVNAMLLNEFLKEHHKVQKLEATVAEQQQDFQSKLAEEEKEIQALTSGLEKVSAQIELNKIVPQMARNNR
jgi:hypothetical protein